MLGNIWHSCLETKRWLSSGSEGLQNIGRVLVPETDAQGDKGDHRMLCSCVGRARVLRMVGCKIGS
eukprot:1262501-Amphidinium_carterae.2